MSEQKESSVLFSLKELMSLEEDRIRNEEAEKVAAAQAAENARLEAERAAREAEEARIRAEQERRRTEEQRAREEAARLEAIRQAEIEKARLDAEQRARMAAMEAQQQHERNLAQLKHDKSKKTLRNALIIGGAVVVLGGSTGGYFIWKNIQAQEAATARAEEDRRKEAEEKAKLLASLAESQKKTDLLLAQLANAKDEATKLALQKQLDEERAKTESMKKATPGRPASQGGASKPCNCTPGDPLCNCL